MQLIAQLYKKWNSICYNKNKGEFQMIDILFDHSYQDDYFILSDISVNIKDPIEKEKIETRIKQGNFLGSLGFPGKDLKKYIAEFLEVDEGLITFDTEEIDLY